MLEQTYGIWLWMKNAQCGWMWVNEYLLVLDIRVWMPFYMTWFVWYLLLFNNFMYLIWWMEILYLQDELCRSNRCFDYILEWSPFRSLYFMAKWHPQKKSLKGNYNFDLFFSTFIIWTDFLLFNILLCENPIENPSKLSNREFLEFRVDWILQIL